MESDRVSQSVDLLQALVGLAQLVRAFSWHTEVVDWMPNQGTYKNQPVSGHDDGMGKVSTYLLVQPYQNYT